MSEAENNQTEIKQYNVTTVEKADPVPEQLQDGNWHRYVIEQGERKIEGYRVGSLKAVKQHAEDVARDLTERANTGKYGHAASRTAKKK